MTYFKGITLRNPIQLQAAGNWNYAGQIHRGSFLTEFYSGGVFDRRGTFQLGANFKLRTILNRNPFGHPGLLVSKDNNLTDFSTLGILPVTSTRTAGFIGTMHHFDGYFWCLGQTNTSLPFMVGLADGTSIPTGASASWVDRSGDTPFGGSQGISMHMRRTTDGKIYHLIARQTGGAAAGVMMANSMAAATSTGFSYITTTAAPDSTIESYGISNDGSIQMMATDNATYRSTDGGVHWANTMNFGTTQSGSIDFVHCPKFGSGHWCCSSIFDAGGKGLWYTNDNGSSWTRSTFIGGGSTVGTNAFTIIEKLDPDGEILLGFYGIAPLQVYISLNGGREWAFVTSVVPPFFDVVGHPEIANEYQLGCILVNDGSRLIMYWPGQTGDEGVFVSDMLNLPTYYREPGDPRTWSP